MRGLSFGGGQRGAPTCHQLSPAPASGLGLCRDGAGSSAPLGAWSQLLSVVKVHLTGPIPGGRQGIRASPAGRGVGFWHVLLPAMLGLG